MERIVLAYSGSLETSIAIPWLREAYGAEVIAVTVDLGQGQELEEVRDRALAAGAARAHVLDLRDELARDYIVPALEAGAADQGGYPLGIALGRPLVARTLVEIAAIEQAGAIAHGCRVNGRDLVRLEAAARALNPALILIATAREWGLSRPDALAYAQQQRVPVPAAAASPFSTRSNLWGRAIAGGLLADPWIEPPEAIYTLTQSSAEWPAEAAYVEIAFDRGAPAAINGVAMPILDLIGSLTTIAGAHGVGRIDTVESNRTGAASREIREAPAALVLHAAHRELQALVTTTDLERFARTAGLEYADLIDRGLWFTPLREALDAFVARVQERVTGTVRLKLFKGDCRIVGRQSPHALCDDALTKPLAAGA